MKEERNEYWNQRYKSVEYVYGEDPNQFFASQLNELVPGKLILPCEGEGRNAVFAAKSGWQVTAFDGSLEGRNKALQLAQKNAVSFNYTIEDATAVQYQKGSVDAVAFIYAHFPAQMRTQIHKNAVEWLKPGGKIIIEAFNPKQLQNHSGGPKDVSMLYTIEMLESDFSGLNIDMIQYVQVILKEGAFHDGIADVIQFVGTKSI